MYIEKISTRLNKEEVEKELQYLFEKENKFNLVLSQNNGSWFLKPNKYPNVFKTIPYKSYLFSFDLQLEVLQRSNNTDIVFTWLSKDLSKLLAISMIILVWTLIISLFAAGKLDNGAPFFAAIFLTILFWYMNYAMKKKDEVVSQYILQRFQELDKQY